MIGVLAAYGWIMQSLLAFIGTLVLASATTAALGACSLSGIPINLLSTHVLPFITVGLAMRDMFLILNEHTKDLSPPEIVSRTGPSIISTMLINAATFLSTAILPVPALRVLALQCAVMVIFHGAAMLVVIPCLLALAQRCRKSDVPCFRKDSKRTTIQNNNNLVSLIFLLFYAYYFKLYLDLQCFECLRDCGSILPLSFFNLTCS